MGDIALHSGNQFDALRLVKDDGTEYWSARDLQVALGYAKWQKFHDVVEKAQQAMYNSGHVELDWVTRAGKPIVSGKGRQQLADDYHLSRYAAYLVAMNGDPRKPEIAAAQHYFAVKTRQAEVAENLLDSLSCDDEERMLIAQLEGVRFRKAAQARIAQLECTIAAQESRVLLAQKFLSNRTFEKPVLLTDVHNMVCGFYAINKDQFFLALRDAGILFKVGRIRPVNKYITKEVWFANAPAIDGEEAKADYTVTPLGVDGIIKLMSELGVKSIKLTQAEANARITRGWQIGA